MKQVFVVYETDAWHTIANRDCKGIYTSKRSAINAIVKNHEIDLEEIFEDDRLERASRRVLPPKLPPKIGIRKFIRRYYDLLKTTKKPLFTGFVNVGLKVYETLRAVMKGSKKLSAKSSMY